MAAGKRGQRKRLKSRKKAISIRKRPKKLRQWYNRSMLKAPNAVRKGELGVNRAALQFSVSATTLKDHVAGRVVHGTNMRPKPYLSNEEEKELMEFLVECSKIGFGKTRREVMKLVEEIVERKGMKLPTGSCLMAGGFNFYKGGQS